MANYENLINLSQLSTFKAQNDLAYAAKSDVTTLVGSDSGKSVRTIANEELAAQLVPENAAAMNAAITALQNKMDTGDQTVSAYVTAAIAALNIGDYATAANLTALADRVTDLETTVEGLGALAEKDTVTESDLDTALAAKVNAAAEGNHAHANKSVLDGITAEKVATWDAKANASDIPTISLASEADILALFQ